MWENIIVGDVIAVHSGCEVPADILLIHTPSNTAFVDSSNIDGEVVLQKKFVFKEDIDKDVIQNLNGQISCDAPNPRLD